MKEATIERKLVSAAKLRGGSCPKWVSPGYDGVPDRIVLLQGGKIGFVEVKALGKKPRPLQTARHKTLMKLGFRVFVIDSPEQIGEVLDEIENNL